MQNPNGCDDFYKVKLMTLINLVCAQASHYQNFRKVFVLLVEWYGERLVLSWFSLSNDSVVTSLKSLNASSILTSSIMLKESIRQFGQLLAGADFLTEG
jgi:hypothetical protein